MPDTNVVIDFAGVFDMGTTRMYQLSCRHMIRLTADHSDAALRRAVLDHLESHVVIQVRLGVGNPIIKEV